jgi:3-dehydroquinate synthase class II
MFAGGPLTIESGGGDISVFDSSSRVAVSTRSGDIRVKLEPNSAGETADLRTARGNVLLEFGKAAKVNVDATIMMDADEGYRFESDFPGLTVVRERVGDRMRVHATGKINGGGPLMMIAADSGSIHLRRTPEKVVGPAQR